MYRIQQIWLMNAIPYRWLGRKRRFEALWVVAVYLKSYPPMHSQWM